MHSYNRDWVSELCGAEKHEKAFSLVELSIVLVILGLLTGGILAGQNLIRASELRSVTTELQKLQSAVYTFKGKYFALPGDMPNATDFWGEAGTGSYSGACPGTQTTPSTDSGTCDGDGDSMIDSLANHATGASIEEYRIWQQLANAGLIEGNYTGVRYSAGESYHCDTNCPVSKISNAGYVLVWIGELAANHFPYFRVGGSVYDGLSNYFQLGANNSGGYNGAFLTPQEAWNIDKKIDDGKPAIGKLKTYRPAHLANCTDSEDPAIALYNLDHAGIACSITMKSGF